MQREPQLRRKGAVKAGKAAAAELERVSKFAFAEGDDFFFPPCSSCS